MRASAESGSRIISGAMAHRSPARNPARYLAPIALVAFALALLIVVTTSGGGDDGGASSPPAATGHRNTTGGTRGPTTTTPTRIPRVYAIKPGDNLSTIADKTGVTVERIQELNPDIDPQALVTGQRLKLRP
jgi:LysM repeat protein